MTYVIRNDDGRYLRVWHSDNGAITRVELVRKGEASSYRTRTEAHREVLDKYPGSNFTVDVR